MADRKQQAKDEATMMPGVRKAESPATRTHTDPDEQHQSHTPEPAHTSMTADQEKAAFHTSPSTRDGWDGKFHIGDVVHYKDGSTCNVQGLKDDGNTLSLLTDDAKHAFDAPASDCTPVAVRLDPSKPDLTRVTSTRGTKAEKAKTQKKE